MEKLIAEELRIEKKLKELEARKQVMFKTNKKVNLTEIETPEDLGAIAEKKRQTASTRNHSLLQNLESESRKLHTQRLCPIDCRLEEVKQRFVQEESP